MEVADRAPNNHSGVNATHRPTIRANCQPARAGLIGPRNSRIFIVIVYLAGMCRLECAEGVIHIMFSVHVHAAKPFKLARTAFASERTSLRAVSISVLWVVN